MISGERRANNANRAITNGLIALHIPVPLTTVQWADEYYYLPKESSYTPGKWETLPFQVAIMNAIGYELIRVVNLIKSARVGYTKMLLGVEGYFIEHKSRNSLLFQPTDSSAEDFMKSHVEPTIRDVPVLARWDTPRVVKGVSFSLRLNVAAEDGSDRLVSSAGTPDTQYRFRGLTPGRYTLSVRAVNSQGQQGDPASTQFSISAPAAPSFIELTPGYFQITATPRQAVYDPTVQYEFWFSDAQITDIHQVENAARYLGTALYWIAASVNIRPGRDYYFYIRAVNQVGKSAFVEATGQASNDAAGYLDFFKGQITESHLGKELLEKVDLTEDNSSKLQQFSKEWKDANDKWNAMWGVKIEQTKDGKYYVAGLGLSMEDTPDGKISQFLVAADRIAYINPANGNEAPGFVMQGDQIIMNEVFLKYLSAPTITSGGNPPAFSLTPDGKLTAKNADISGHINAVSGSFTGEINATSGKFSGVIEAREFVGDICGSKVMQGVSIRATNDERSTSTRYTDSATYQIGKTITVMANCERNGGSGAITVTININGQVKTGEVMPYTAGIPAMYQTVVFSVYTTSPVVDISVSLRVRGQYTTSASVWPLVMVSRSGSNFTN
ncbi:hypothetical protein DN344_23480 [Salmonella enterica subsp. enterica serovar Mississippi]|nr:hypothetical protein [Salmonella enterica subsp. enterica serovar Mississippi]